MLNWFLFISVISLMYVCISTIGKLTGNDPVSLSEGVKRVFTPTLVALMFLGNVLFAIGLYYGFIVTSNALTIAIVIGIMTSFLYSVVVFGVPVTAIKIFGLGFVLLGLYFLK